MFILPYTVWRNFLDNRSCPAYQIDHTDTIEGETIQEVKEKAIAFLLVYNGCQTLEQLLALPVRGSDDEYREIIFDDYILEVVNKHSFTVEGA